MADEIIWQGEFQGPAGATWVYEDPFFTLLNLAVGYVRVYGMVPANKTNWLLPARTDLRYKTRSHQRSPDRSPIARFCWVSIPIVLPTKSVPQKSHPPHRR
jgi:hypothetical protein